MVQESQDTQTPEGIAANDNAVLEGEQNVDVTSEIQEVVEKVDDIRIGWWKEFLGLYNTKIGALRIASLDKARAEAANDNNTEAKKAA